MSVPQKPEDEQQVPNIEPMQVKLLVPPQEPSGDSLPPVQVPNVGWQPPPQWAVELPQKPD